jgi:hypothetical protein
MNRHERRKQRAQERKARRHGDTMGAGYTVTNEPPRWMQEHPAFIEGQRAAKSGELPPRYYEDIQQAARLIYEWYQAQPEPPELRWVEERDDGTFMIAALDAPHLLADSPDAFRLLAWLDEQTGRKLTIYQARWALRLCRALPMQDGSYYGVETKFESKALQALRAFANDVKNEGTTALAIASPCGHCGKELDAASAAPGERPEPGCYSICTACGGLSRFDDEMRLVRVSDEELAEMPEYFQAQAQEMKALILQGKARHQMEGLPGKKTVIEA